MTRNPGTTSSVFKLFWIYFSEESNKDVGDSWVNNSFDRSP